VVLMHKPAQPVAAATAASSPPPNPDRESP